MLSLKNVPLSLAEFNMHTTDVLFEERKGREANLGIITLNRPQVLNALNHDMVLAMYAKLQDWMESSHIKAVIIRAAPSRAFCAGGDIRLTYERGLKKDPKARDFFKDEYQLNKLIFHYPKPYIALLDGITMGGGVGISVHGSHRVATEKLLFAMPETGIGFFPDVGGTYFLPRLPNHMGYYLGLSGARINSDDCVSIGIATQKIKSDSLLSLIDALADTTFSSDARASVTEVIRVFESKVDSSQLIEDWKIIGPHFYLQSMEEIEAALLHSDKVLAKEIASLIAKKSPTSLKVTLRALKAGSYLSFDEVMNQEYRLSSHFLQAHDFFEGIRAAIIDKDQQPKWSPALLNEVKNTDIEKYFAPLTHELI